MSLRILVYEKKIGRITKRMIVPPNSVDLQCSESEDWMLGDADDLTQYVALDADGIPTITPRPAMNFAIDTDSITANAIDVATITGIPEGATVTSSGNSAVVDSGSLEFVTDQVGTHALKFELFPYLDAEVTINAV